MRSALTYRPSIATWRDLAALGLRLDRRASALAEVDDPGDLDAGRLEIGRGLEAAIVDREHDGALGAA